jgi:hypothetical protein
VGSAYLKAKAGTILLTISTASHYFDR